MCSVSGPLQTRCFMLSERSAPLSALCQGLISISTSLKKKHLGLPSSPRGFIPSLFDYEVKNLILLLLLLSSPQYILHPPPPTLSSPRMADSKRLFCFFYKVEGVHDQVYGGCLWFRVVVCPRCFLRALETASGFYARVAHSQI